MAFLSSLPRYGYLVGLLFLLLPRPVCRAQAPGWQAAVAAGGPSAVVLATAADAAGNVYVAGYFGGTATFGGTALASVGQMDAFVAKWNPALGGFAWARRMGGPGDDLARGVAVSNGNVYVVGDFSGATADFGPTVLANTSPGSAFPSRDVFVAKLADAGPTAAFGWALRAGGSGSEVAFGVVAQAANVYLTGTFSGTAGFGGLTLASGGADAYVAKIADAGPTGAFVWALQSGSGGGPEAAAVAVQGANVYIAGNFRSAATFGSAVLPAPNQDSDIFVAKATDAGPTAAFEWAQRAGGTSNDMAFGVAASGSSVYVVGEFTATASFGPTTFTSLGNSDVFVAKLNDAGRTGSFGWAQRAGGSGAETAYAVVANGPNVYVGGDFNSNTAAFGPTVLANATTVGRQSDLFVARLTDLGATGSFAWAQRAGSPTYEVAGALALGAGRLYVTGVAGAATAFGTLPALRQDGGYLAAIADPALTAARPDLPAAGIGLFPNPAHGRATVQLPASTGPATLTLLDALGRPVRTQTAAGLQAELDLTGLAPGLYAVRVQAGGATTTQKLLVE